MQKNGNKKYLEFGFFWGVVFVAMLILSRPAQAATLYLSPASASYRVGDSFQVSVYVSSPDQAINTAQAVVAFPTDKLQVLSATTKSSIFSLMVETPSYSNNAGSVNFAGIILNPGYTGSRGRLLTINVRARAVGKANLSISSGQVLANDGSGTSVLTGRSGATINILEALPPPPPPPKQVPLPSAVFQPSTTVIFVTTTEFVTPTTTVCGCCNVNVLPNIFLKLGRFTYGAAALSIIFLTVLLAVSALLSGWGFWEMAINKNKKKHNKK